MQATLRQYRQSPRKVRLAADLVRGKTVEQALTELEYTQKRAAETLAKLIRSAVANAKDKEGKEASDLVIENITVDEGETLKRFRPRARGRASRINKRTSHITVTLREKVKATAK
ncbi:MAG: 50S ribosomal protein L22 [Candidatus Paceibacterota bacterium]